MHISKMQFPRGKRAGQAQKYCLQALTTPVNSNAIQQHSGCKDFGRKKCSVGQNNSRVEVVLTFFFINAMKTDYSLNIKAVL